MEDDSISSLLFMPRSQPTSQTDRVTTRDFVHLFPTPVRYQEKLWLNFIRNEALEVAGAAKTLIDHGAASDDRKKNLRKLEGQLARINGRLAERAAYYDRTAWVVQPGRNDSDFGDDSPDSDWTADDISTYDESDSDVVEIARPEPVLNAFRRTLEGNGYFSLPWENPLFGRRWVREGRCIVPCLFVGF